MTEDEKIAALTLTPEQAKLFKKLQKALDACKKAGIVLIGKDEFQYAVNGLNLEAHRDTDYGAFKETEIDLQDLDAPCIGIQEPYVSIGVALEVKEQN